MRMPQKSSDPFMQIVLLVVFFIQLVWFFLPEDLKKPDEIKRKIGLDTSLEM